MSTNQTKMYGILALVVIVAGASLAALVIFQPPGENETDPYIEVVGVELSVNITLSQILSKSSIIRNGSYQNSFGNVRGAGEYQGVLVSNLLDAVGGLGINDTVTVKASDGYSQTFDYSKVYPNQTILDIQGDMVIAMGFNGSLVPAYEDGFRLMFLPEDGYYSNEDANATTDPNPYAAGPQCVSNVAKLIVNPYTGPEPVLFSLTYENTTLRYTMSELKEFVSVTGEGGYKRNSGTIISPETFKGVPFTTLWSEFSSMPANYSVIVKAGDGWISEYTKEIVEGTVNGYTPAGAPLAEIMSTLILAYEMNGAPISVGEGGPLRVAFLNEDGNLTDGFRWAKDIVNITVVEEPVTGGLFLLQENSIDRIEIQCITQENDESI